MRTVLVTLGYLTFAAVTVLLVVSLMALMFPAARAGWEWAVPLLCLTAIAVIAFAVSFLQSGGRR